MRSDVGVRWRRWLGSNAVVAALVGALSLTGHYLVTGIDAPPRALDWVGYLLLTLGAAVLVLRQRLPLATLTVTTAGVITTLALGVGHDGPFILLPAMVALYTVAEAGRRVPAVIAAMAIVVTFVAAVLRTGGANSQGLLWASAWLAVAIVTGEVVKNRRDYLAAVHARAIEAERTREEEGRRRAGEERLRIARELHDVLGHSLSVINVQAGTAAHVVARQPEKAHDALETIRQTSQRALRELRGTLGALQQPDEDASLSPAPSLTRLDELIRPLSVAGVDVEVAVTGRPRSLPTAVDQAAYRIVQESLTNVLRHANAASATVRFGYGKHDLVVEVEDAGAGVVGPQELEVGTGVAGMRERAAAMGGALDVAAPADGGVRVRARLPLHGS